MFESIGLIQLSFPPNPTIKEKINNVEAILTKTEDIFPKETMIGRVLWVMKIRDAEQEISNQQKQQIPYIEKALKPTADLMDYLQTQIGVGLK